MKRALLSVWDKSGLIPFASGLAAAGYELVSTGGTARAHAIAESCRAKADVVARDEFETGETMRVHMRYRADGRIERPVFGLAIHRHDGVHICGPNTAFSGFEIPWVEGEGEIIYTIPSLPLLEGMYLLSVSATDDRDIEIFDYHDRAYPFRVRRGRHQERF